MKATKVIDVTTSGVLRFTDAPFSFDIRFTLEFNQDKDGNEIGILTVPFVNAVSKDEVAVAEHVYQISGKELECIEKQYFDNNVITIPIKDRPDPVDMEDVLLRIIPQKIYNQMINGTYKIAAGADKSIYGNMPVKIDKSAKPARAGTQPRAKIMKDPSADAYKEVLKNILPEYEQILNGTYDTNAGAAEPKPGNKPKKAKKA